MRTGYVELSLSSDDRGVVGCPDFEEWFSRRIVMKTFLEFLELFLLRGKG